jgi:hypothetical protein
MRTVVILPAPFGPSRARIVQSGTLTVRLQDWGPSALFGAVAGLVLIDVFLTILAAATWRREEVLSHT